MTKERKLAIEMWKDIRSKIIALDHGICHAAIAKYKHAFCEQHNLHWVLNCWFCQYLKRDSLDCNGCPLGRCNHGYYDIVVDEARDKDVRVEACNNIIKALGGSV